MTDEEPGYYRVGVSVLHSAVARKDCQDIPIEYYRNSMMHDDDDTIDWNTVPPAKVFHFLMQGLVDTYNVLKGDMTDMKMEMKRDIAALGKKLLVFLVFFSGSLSSEKSSIYVDFRSL